MPTENQVKLAAIAHQWGGTNYRDGISGPVKGVMLTFEQLEHFAQALIAKHELANVATGANVPLRDHFAALAMSGWLSTYPADVEAGQAEQSAAAVAHFAYRMADAMARERVKE